MHSWHISVDAFRSVIDFGSQRAQLQSGNFVQLKKTPPSFFLLIVRFPEQDGRGQAQTIASCFFPARGHWHPHIKQLKEPEEIPSQNSGGGLFRHQGQNEYVVSLSVFIEIACMIFFKKNTLNEMKKKKEKNTLNLQIGHDWSNFERIPFCGRESEIPQGKQKRTLLTSDPLMSI